jgi:MoaA/NifB/PqqE/SkfB family radical SAM enzyme
METLSFIKNHTPAQNLNAAKYFLNRKKPLTRLPWNPVYSTIIVESKCNRRCKYCIWHSKHTPRPYWPVHLSFEDFKKIADILGSKNLAHMHFCGTGEPIFNKDLFKMIAYAQQKKMTTSMMANFSKALTPHIDRIANSKLIRVFTNLDSGFPDEFEEIREYGKWDTTIENIKKLSDARKKARKKFKIGVYCIAMRSNYKSYRNLMKTASDIGVDEIWFSYLQPFEDMNDLTSRKNIIQKSDKHILKEIDIAIELGRELGLHVFPPHFPPKTKSRVNCDTMWWKIMVNLPNDKIPKEKWIGNVSSHCFLTHIGEAYTYGNLLTDDFDDVWNGEILVGLREKLLKDAPEVCRTCPDL